MDSASPHHDLPSFICEACEDLGVPPDFVSKNCRRACIDELAGSSAATDIVLEALIYNLYVGDSSAELVSHIERLLFDLVLSRDLAGHGLSPQRLSEGGVLPSLEPTPKRAVAQLFLFHCVTEARVQLELRLREGRPIMAYLHTIADHEVTAWHNHVDPVGARTAEGCRELVSDPRFRTNHDFRFVAEDGRVISRGDEYKPALRLGEIMRGSLESSNPDASVSGAPAFEALFELELTAMSKGQKKSLIRGPIGVAEALAPMLSRSLGEASRVKVPLNAIQKLVRPHYERYFYAQSGDAEQRGVDSDSNAPWVSAIASARDAGSRSRILKAIQDRVLKHALAEVSY